MGLRFQARYASLHTADIVPDWFLSITCATLSRECTVARRRDLVGRQRENTVKDHFSDSRPQAFGLDRDSGASKPAMSAAPILDCCSGSNRGYN